MLKLEERYSSHKGFCCMNKQSVVSKVIKGVVTEKECGCICFYEEQIKHPQSGFQRKPLQDYELEFI